MILGEVGDIHRFLSPSKLLAYARRGPSVYQSGNFQAKRTRISKCGSKVLRYALMCAVRNVVKKQRHLRSLL
ncbi:MAG: transposase [Clostridia bacterium]